MLRCLVRVILICLLRLSCNRHIIFGLCPGYYIILNNYHTVVKWLYLRWKYISYRILHEVIKWWISDSFPGEKKEI